MKTMNISLPDEMKTFIETQMSQEGYAVRQRVSSHPYPRGPEAPGQAGAGSEAAGGVAESGQRDD